MADEQDQVNLVKTLLDIPLFEDLDYTHISTLIEVSNQREAAVGEVLCQPRTMDEKLLVFLKGKLRLESADGEKLAEMHPVRVVGEMGVFTGQLRASRVVVQEPASLLEIDSGSLEELVEEDPGLGNHMMVNLIKLLYTRVHEMNDDLAATKDTAERLRERLEELSPNDPVVNELYSDPSDDLEL